MENSNVPRAERVKMEKQFKLKIRVLVQREAVPKEKAL